MNRSQPNGRAPLASSPDVAEPQSGRPGPTLGCVGRGCRRILGLLLVGLAVLASGCSTMTVPLQGLGDRGMNPAAGAAAEEQGAPLEVFAFFLKRRETFESRPLRDFLTPDLKKNLKVPEFLANDAVGVQRLMIVPGQADHKPTRCEGVSKEAQFVGLVAVFQDHDDSDAKENWRLVLPAAPSEDWVVRFYVRGKRLEAKPAEAPVAKPAPAATATPEQAK